MKTALWIPIVIAVTMFVFQLGGSWQSETLAAEPFRPLGLPQVKVGGEIGRRIDADDKQQSVEAKLGARFS